MKEGFIISIGLTILVYLLFSLYVIHRLTISEKVSAYERQMQYYKENSELFEVELPNLWENRK